jgi:hypothetical protein
MKIEMQGWRNRLGHDSDSELQTVIKRMREGQFVIKSTHDNCVEISVSVTYWRTVPVPGRRTYVVDYRIYRDGLNSFSFEQVKGMPRRQVPLVPGYVIWSLAEEKFYEEEVEEVINRKNVRYFSWNKLRRMRSLAIKR